MLQVTLPTGRREPELEFTVAVTLKLDPNADCEGDRAAVMEVGIHGWAYGLLA
jgi:hypothetical protein